MTHLIAQTTDPTTLPVLPPPPASWRDPAAVYWVLTALMIFIGFAAAVWVKINNVAAKADTAKSLSETNAGHLQSVDRQMTTIALHTPAPSQPAGETLVPPQRAKVPPPSGEHSL